MCSWKSSQYSFQGHQRLGHMSSLRVPFFLSPAQEDLWRDDWSLANPMPAAVRMWR